jgi:hypothetical protein
MLSFNPLNMGLAFATQPYYNVNILYSCLSIPSIWD